MTDTKAPMEAIPEGWQLVPIQMDVGMIGAWYRYKNGHHWPDEPPPRDTSDVGAWAALLAASPVPALALPHTGAVTWKPVDENTPRGELLLYFPSEKTLRGDYRHAEMIKVDRYPVSYPRQPTYWMPVPAKPNPAARSALIGGDAL